MGKKDFNYKQRRTNSSYRDGWDRIFKKNFSKKEVVIEKKSRKKEQENDG